MFLKTIHETIDTHRMLTSGDRVLVGVSGGPDSISLLMALLDLGYLAGVAHLNHGLRGAESDADEDFVRALSERLQAPFFSARAQIPPDGGNVEAQARSLRRAFFSSLCNDGRFTRIALAHTRDDRVETFLLNLLRGAGIEGLTSMAPVTGTIIRPLIDVSRSEVEDYLRQRDQVWRVDSSNLDIRFSRNRLRHTVIPDLETRFNVNLRTTLLRTIEILEDERAWATSLTEQWIALHGTRRPPASVIDAKALAQEPKALQRRVLRELIREISGSLENVTFDHVESARRLLMPGKSGRIAELPDRVVVMRSFEELIVRRRAEPAAAFEYELQIPGEVHIPEVSRTFKAEIIQGEDAKRSTDRVFVDGERLGRYVKIRNWKPGDYYRPVGLPAGKLKKLFQRARIPREERHRWPVFVSDASIVWVASFPVSREYAPGSHSQKIVAFEAAAI